jgi:hypothetical protein
MASENTTFSGCFYQQGAVWKDNEAPVVQEADFPVKKGKKGYPQLCVTRPSA